jgi:hypothetical protein
MCKQDAPPEADNKNNENVHSTASKEEEESPAATENAEQVPVAPNNHKHTHKPLSGKELGVMERSLEDGAGIFSLWTLTFLNPLLSLGSRKVLDSDDIGVPSSQDDAERAYQAAKQAWQGQQEKCALRNNKIKAKHQARLDACSTQEARDKIPPLSPKKLKEPSMSFALVTSFGKWRLILAMTYYVISALLGFVPVLILNDLVRYFEHVATGGTSDDYDGSWYSYPWGEVAALGVVPLLISALQTRYGATMSHCGVFVRTAVSMMLYKKSLRVSAAGRAKTSTGQVVNMMSNDTMQLQRFLQFGGMTIVAPIQIIVALVLIYGQVSVQI